MHEVLVNRLGGLSPPRKSVVRLTDRSDMTFDVYRGRKTIIQQHQQSDNLNHGAKLSTKLKVEYFSALLHQECSICAFSFTSCKLSNRQISQRQFYFSICVYNSFNIISIKFDNKILFIAF